MLDPRLYLEVTEEFSFFFGEGLQCDLHSLELRPLASAKMMGKGGLCFWISGPGRPNELQGQSRCSVLRRVPKTTRG